MPDADPYHCLLCSRRPRVNLTELDGKLIRPECLYARDLARITPTTKGAET